MITRVVTKVPMTSERITVWRRSFGSDTPPFGHDF
jgi:hypothetical protein